MSDAESKSAHDLRREHRHLDALFDEVRGALGDGERERAEEAIARLDAAFDVHFEQEDLLYHSAIRALRPGQASALGEIRRAHDRIRDTFAGLRQRLAAGEEASEVVRAIDDLARSFEAHERTEEELLRALETQDTVPE